MSLTSNAKGQKGKGGGSGLLFIIEFSAESNTPNVLGEIETSNVK